MNVFFVNENVEGTKSCLILLFHMSLELIHYLCYSHIYYVVNEFYMGTKHISKMLKKSCVKKIAFFAFRYPRVF